MMNSEYQLIQNIFNDDNDNEIEEKTNLNQKYFLFLLYENSSNVMKRIIFIEISIALMIPILRLFIKQKRCENIISNQTMRQLHQYLIMSLIIMFIFIYRFINSSIEKAIIEMITFAFIIIHFCIYILENKDSKKNNLVVI